LRRCRADVYWSGSRTRSLRRDADTLALGGQRRETPHPLLEQSFLLNELAPPFRRPFVLGPAGLLALDYLDKSTPSSELVEGAATGTRGAGKNSKLTYAYVVWAGAELIERKRGADARARESVVLARTFFHLVKVLQLERIL